MKVYPSALVRVGVAIVVVGAALVYGADRLAAQLPLAPPRDAGQSVTPAYEGWYKNDDGSFTLLVGYFNRNLKETFDIPIGPNNRIEPGGPDLGQPTHFLPRRQWGILAIKVPADFGTKKYTWTIVANGQTMSIPLALTKGYQIEPMKDAAMGNTPPVFKFSPTGPAYQGPPGEAVTTLDAMVGQPLELNVWASDDAFQDPRRAQPMTGPPVTVTWALHRGEGEVTFSQAKPKVDMANGGKATTSATFSRPGAYVLRVQGNDSSGEGGGGFQCCWTNAFVKVNVRPSSTAGGR
jgi:hypothetical protein